METVEFVASVYKVQTLATDCGVRVTLDLPETAIMQMAQLAECKRAGVVLKFTAQVQQDTLKNGEREWQREW